MGSSKLVDQIVGGLPREKAMEAFRAACNQPGTLSVPEPSIPPLVARLRSQLRDPVRSCEAELLQGIVLQQITVDRACQIMAQWAEDRKNPANVYIKEEPIAYSVPYADIVHYPARPSLNSFWEKARKDDTVESYRDFLHACGDSNQQVGEEDQRNINYARKRVDALLWEQVTRIGTIASILDYLAESPNGEFVVSARGKLAELVDRSTDSLPALVAALQYWPVAPLAAELLKRTDWRPQLDRDTVHLLVAQRNGYELRKKWETTKCVLLADVEVSRHRSFKTSFRLFFGSGVSQIEATERRAIENALYAFIGIGRPEVIPVLVDTLKARGTKMMAEAFLNCRYAQLEEAARQWAKSHGYEIKTGSGAHPVSWGTM